MFTLGRKEQVIILAVIGILVFTAGYQWSARSKVPVELVPAKIDSVSQEQILVHVDGAVEKPGVYTLSQGSRVNDAITQAVSLPESDLGAVNLAAPLKDGQKLVIPFVTKEPVAVGKQTEGYSVDKPVNKLPSAPRSSPGMININTASGSELEGLPGIGPALAARIIEHRQVNGMFLSIEELKNVSGIGEKKYANLEHLITVQ